MRRAVITGMGIVSGLGNDLESVTESLRQGRSGIRFNETYRELGFRSQIASRPDVDLQSIDRKLRRFMGDSAAYAYLAMQQALESAQISEQTLKSERTGVVAGSGGASCEHQIAAVDNMRAKGVRRIGPYMVPRIMTSTVSASLATAFGIRGVNYSISSACATSAHCIGHAWEQIQLGKQDVIFAGGGEEEHWGLTMMFDAMGALSTGYNDTPEKASRPFDSDRDGFVIAGGGGMVVVEELEHAKKRGAPILAEVIGYGATSDGADMVAPSGEGAERCMHMALETVDTPVDYINAHGTSTPAGDITELQAVERVFGARMPPVSSTKSLTGHSLGAAGVQELIYTVLMMRHGFVAGTANLDNPDPSVAHYPLPRKSEAAALKTVMSNSFGFGGTNATLVLRALA